MKTWEIVTTIAIVAAAGAAGYYIWRKRRTEAETPAQELAPAPPRARKKKRGLFDKVGLGGLKGVAQTGLTAVGTVYGGPVGGAIAAKAGESL